MSMEYDRRPTRVYQREDHNIDTHDACAVEPTGGARPQSDVERDERIGYTQPIATAGSVFDGISIAQVIAGAAAAATSMLLASKIGIAGSVIGAAVSSAVTIVCSQLYRHALDASAKRLRAKQAHGPSRSAAYGVDGTSGTSGGTHASGSASSASGSVDNRALITDPSRPVRGARIAPTKLQARAAAERSATQRKVVFASIVLAIATVALCAGAILAGTAGEGLGTKPTALLAQSSAPAPDAGADAATNTDAPDASTTPDDPANTTSDAASSPDAPADDATAGTDSSDDAASKEPSNNGATQPETPEQTPGSESSTPTNQQTPRPDTSTPQPQQDSATGGASANAARATGAVDEP